VYKRQTIDHVDNQADGITAQLSDGTSAEADLLIAADGVRSAHRAAVIGDADPYRFLGYRYAAYDVPGQPDAAEVFTGYVAPGRTCEFYRLSEGRLAALHVWASDCPGGAGGRADLPALAALHADDAPEVRNLIAAAIIEGSRPVIDDLLMVDISRWSHNRIVLLGDAAHCLTLISGQGAGMALTGAAALADALTAEPSIKQALAAYEASMRPPIVRLQQRSRSIARWFVPRTQLAYLVRNTTVRLLPRPVLTRYFRRAIASELDAAGTREQPAS
jgi:2-polyprenyl-6-methoxyphenol hydroxylase-like FAD-dependent oxidoreductase